MDLTRKRDLIQNHAWQLGNLMVYSKPGTLDAAYGNFLIPFPIYLRLRSGRS